MHLRIFSDAGYSLGAALAFRFLPIALAIALSRIGGQSGLEAQSAFYVYLSLTTTIAVGGLSPFLLFSMGNATTRLDMSERDRIWTSSFRIYNALICLFFLVLPLFIQASTLQYAVHVVALYLITTVTLLFVRWNGERRYGAVFSMTLVLFLLILLVTAGLSVVIDEPNVAVPLGYAFGAIAVLAMMVARDGNPFRLKAASGLIREEWVAVVRYEATQVLTVGTIFLSMAFLRYRLSSAEFNGLVFHYQLYSLCIYGPGLLASVVVPRLAGKVDRSRAMGATLRLSGVYLAATVAVLALVIPTLPLLGRLYGITLSHLDTDHMLLLGAALPSAVIAANNQINTASNSSVRPMVASIAASSVFAASHMLGAIVENFGATLLIAMCCAMLVNTFFLLRDLSSGAST